MESDKDLQARQEARQLCRAAAQAQKELARMDQAQLDTIAEAVGKAISQAAVELAQMAVEETGFGNVEDKTAKNRFAGDRVWEAIRDMRCVGLLEKKEKIWEIGVPVGVIGAIVPSTNPTSTVCYKAMIALKSGNSIVFSPHPKAAACTVRAAQIAAQAAETAGAPAGCIGCLRIPAMAGCRELMENEHIRLILATGGPAMVKAAYSSGKPAIGVGAGNGPAYIHSSADVGQAMEGILRSKTFDNGTVCASEQSILVEKSMEDRVVAEGKKLGFYFLSREQAAALARKLFRPDGAMNPAAVGRTAGELAALAGFSVPPSAKVLVARETGVGAAAPYSQEKLCPVLGFYVEENEQAVRNRAVEILQYEGRGHTFAIHAREEAVVARFAERIPVSRFLVNTPAALGGIGATTELFPALTLGCGAVGGSASSNNISPMDLINIRRVAWGVEEKASETQAVDAGLVERLTEEILKRLK